MPMAAPPPSPQAAPVARDRGDACPGTLRLHAADDGALARVRIPGGVLTVGQARALGAAALRLGDGELHLTSRGNVQLRGLGQTCGAELAELLTAAGLLPSPAHERVRNIVASPLSGLDGNGLRDVRTWLTELDAALCTNAAARELSGRFLFALDDGRGDVAHLDADVTVRALGEGAHLVPGSVAVAPEDAARAALAAAEAFLAAASAGGTRAWRMSELGLSQDELDALVRRRLTEAGIGHLAHDALPSHSGPAEGPAPGTVANGLSVHVPLGRFSAAQWREVTRTARTEVRLTPWRGVVVPLPGLPAAEADGLLARLHSVGLVTDPASPWPRVGACVGRPGCAKAHADVRADAARTLDAAAGPGLPLYWSGCERRCGRPRGAHADVVAAAGGGYRVALAGAGGPARTVEADTPSQVSAALAAITP
ncbi:precorrin-3B synthase [Streptomyces sp. cg36]|uniref:precorrin-3B synthase n=1 Tax=Streptomyces sp. cg36 TaxID=3238798 RepID=UPI0034E20BC9